MMNDRKVTTTHLSCGCDWNGKRWTYCAQHETAPPGVVKLGDLVRPTNSMGSGEVTLQQKLAPPTDDRCQGAAPTERAAVQQRGAAPTTGTKGTG